MKFSVIITTYRCEPWLGACRDSVRAAIQRLGESVELIEIENDAGPGVARNEGLNRAHGDYVMFVDGDDTLSIDAFVGLKDITADIVTFLPPVGVWDVTKKNVRARLFSPMVGNLLAWNAVYKRSVIADWRFPPLHNCEDLVWTTGMFARAKSVEGGREGWYNHREVTTGLSHTYSWHRIGESLCAVGLIISASRGAHVGWLTYFILVRKLILFLFLHVFMTVPKMCLRHSSSISSEKNA